MCTPLVEEETMRRSSPTVESVLVANVWEATEEPLSDVIVPPAPPASTPQANVPLDQRSFSVELLHAVRLAPKSEARVRPPVEDALRKERELVVNPVVVREDTVVVASVEVPKTERIPVDKRLDDWRLPDTERLEVDALASVDCPVTSRVVRLADPMRAP